MKLVDEQPFKGSTFIVSGAQELPNRAERVKTLFKIPEARTLLGLRKEKGGTFERSLRRFPLPKSSRKVSALEFDSFGEVEFTSLDHRKSR